jgi:hypothetical protein
VPQLRARPDSPFEVCATSAARGDAARAQSCLAWAEGTRPLWRGGPRAAALAVARAAVLTAEGNRDEAAAALADAVAGVAQAGQVLKQARRAPPCPGFSERELLRKKLRGRVGEGVLLIVDTTVRRREEAKHAERSDQRGFAGNRRVTSRRRAGRGSGEVAADRVMAATGGRWLRRRSALGFDWWSYTPGSSGLLCSSV